MRITNDIANRIAVAQHEIRRAEFGTESFEFASLPAVLPATAALVSAIIEAARLQAEIDPRLAETLGWWFAIPLLDVLSPAGGMTLVTQLLAALLARFADDVAEHGGEHTTLEVLETLVGHAAPARRGELRRFLVLARQPESEWAPGSGDAWHRAAPLVFVPECVIPGISRTWCRRYRDYLALTILVDDANDVVEDLRAGRETWPVRRMTALGWSPMRGGATRQLANEIAEAVTLYRDRIATDQNAHALKLLSQLLRP